MIDLTDYVSKLNDEGIRFHKAGGDAIFDKLKALSVRLCADLDKTYPMQKNGKQVTETPENLCLAANMILTAWLAWVLRSKSIWHNEARHPENELHLVRNVLPTIIDAYGQGIDKAIRDKAQNGRVPKCKA